jgi:hypothetical protein
MTRSFRRTGASLLAVVLLATTGVAAAQASGAARPGTQAPVRAEPTPRLAEQTFQAWDADRNGALSRQAFVSGWTQLRRAGVAQGSLRRQFQAVDANDNQAIDAGEYRNLVLVRSAGDGAPPLSSFDRNGNQRLEFAEYLVLVRQLGGRHYAAPPKPAAPGSTPTR